METEQPGARGDAMHLPCDGCGGPHRFDTSVPSDQWNRVIRARSLPDYLCTTCIVEAFASAGENFTAQLYGEGHHGTPVEVLVRSPHAVTVAEIQERFLRHYAEWRKQNVEWLESEIASLRDALLSADAQGRLQPHERAALRLPSPPAPPHAPQPVAVGTPPPTAAGGFCDANQSGADARR